VVARLTPSVSSATQCGDTRNGISRREPASTGDRRVAGLLESTSSQSLQLPTRRFTLKHDIRPYRLPLHAQYTEWARKSKLLYCGL